MNPVIFEYGLISLHWYGFLIVGGAVIAAWFAGHYAKKAGENPDHIWNLLAWSLVVGIIGARLYHVFSNPADGYGWPYYRENPIEIINFWNGGFRGLGIYGGLVGGILAVLLYCWRNSLQPVRYLDFIAPNVLLAQAIGRLGNFVNQELYGPPTTLPWAFHINPHYPCQLPPDLPQTIQLCGTPTLTEETLAWYTTHGYHPTFFYEAGWNFLMFLLVAFVIWRYGHRLRTGDGVLLYLLAYPLGRFWVELFRPDAWVMGTLPTAQWIAIGAVLFAVIALLVRHRGWSWRDHPEDSLAMLSRQPSPRTPTQATISM